MSSRIILGAPSLDFETWDSREGGIRMKNDADILSRKPMRICAHVLASVLPCLLSCLTLQAPAQTPNSKVLQKDAPMTHHVEGSFDVKMTPIATDDVLSGTQISRYSLVKQYHGDLDAASKGEMLGAGDPTKGTAGYVAIEQITGTLQGHTGSFALQHLGSMEGGNFKLSVDVVPGSGTAELTGIAGTLNIVINAGKHSYTFDYTLPAAAQ